MASSQFTATEFKNGRAGSAYTYWRSGFPSGTNTTNMTYQYHPLKSWIFFDEAAINTALVNKVVDSVSLTLTPGNYTGRQSATIYAWRMANCTAMPDGGAMSAMMSGIATTTGTNSYWVEQLTGFTCDANNVSSGTIASGAAAIRLVDSLKAGNSLGLFNRCGYNEGDTVYLPSAGLQYNGGDVAPSITITYHDAGSVYTNVGGVWKLGAPQANVSGTWRAGEAWVNVGGVWKHGNG